ncbi:hypothetical protein OIU91_06065 [Streptomyces sp. NBC_01456]|uniref:hypothetical protein n=1 Tax=Streptomyces sp. NBC_01456 TaxID=2975868 RepID=UPI002E3165D2|nr:hypothetical protein [Streptomyces sp. NBC_01456]
MARITVESPIRPQDATCCGKPLQQVGSEVWECQDCGCRLRAQLSGFVPPGWRMVTDIDSRSCSAGHTYEPGPDSD